MMLITMEPGIAPDSPEVDQVRRSVEGFPNIQTEVRLIDNGIFSQVEVYLIGPTDPIPAELLRQCQGVADSAPFAGKLRIVGRHSDTSPTLEFVYKGVHLGGDNLHVFPGLCAVDSRESVTKMFRALKEQGVQTARAGAYKPRTSPYDFQGLGADCLPYVFESAGDSGIRIIAIEITHESHLDEIQFALEDSGHPTGVMVQIGTRNAQNFELLKAVGQQKEFPVLFKRGMGITLQESLSACEYIALGGNRNIIFCLRGVKTSKGDPHRNLVDFAHVPVIHRKSRLPVCIDPSHSVGDRSSSPDGLMDIFNATAQGVIVGANMVLVDFHPDPDRALCDGPQALLLDELPAFLDDVGIVRRAYERRRKTIQANETREWVNGTATPG